MASVLVIDDDPQVRGFLSALLGRDGHEVRAAEEDRRAEVAGQAAWRQSRSLARASRSICRTRSRV